MMMTMSKKVWGRVRRYLKSTRAVSALEYAILVGVIAIAVTAGLTAFSGTLETAITKLGTEVTKAVATVKN